MASMLIENVSTARRSCHIAGHLQTPASQRRVAQSRMEKRKGTCQSKSLG